MAYVVGVESGSGGPWEAVGCTSDSRDVVVVVLDYDTAGWDLVEDTSNLYRGPDLDPGIYHCPFVLGDDIHVRGNLDVAEREAVIGPLTD